MLIAAAVVRLVLIWHVTWVPISDSRDYHDFAHSLTSGAGYQQVYAGETPVLRGLTLRAYRMPGYPAILAVLYSIGGWNPRHAYVANVLFDLVTLVAVLGIGRALFDRRTALVAAGLVGMHVLWTPHLVTEALFTALFAALGWLLVTRLRAASLGAALAYGLLLVLAVFVRPIGVVALPIGLWVVLRSAGWRRGWVPALLVATPTVLGLTAWSVRNAQVLGAAVVSTNFGAHNAKPFGVDFDRIAADVRRRGGGELEIDRELRRQIGLQIRHDPRTAWRTYSDRAVGLLQQRRDWIVETLQMRRTFTGPSGAVWVKRAYTRLRELYPLVYAAGLLGGVLLLVQRRSVHGLWWLFAAYILLHAAVSMSSIRFAAPLYPFICLAAAFAATQAIAGVTALVRRS